MSPVRNVGSRRILSWVLSALALAGCPPAGAQTETYTDTVEVREAEVLVEMPGDFRRKDLRRLRAADLSVLVGGKLRSPTKIDVAAGASEEGSGAILLYFDATLGAPPALALAALALARRAERLTGMGAVEIAVADPEPRVVLEPTRAVRAVEQALAEIAAEARRREGLRAAPRSSGSSDPVEPGAEATPIGAWVHLREWAAFRAVETGSPRVLFLVAGAESPSADSAEVLLAAGESIAAAGGGAGEAESFAAAVIDAGRELAADGWAVVGLTLRPGELERAAPAPAEIHYPDGTSRPFLDIFGILVRLFSKKQRRGQIVDPRLFEAQTDLRWAPLQRLARDTAGGVVRYEELLDPVLDRLAGRRRVWYRAPTGGAAEESFATLEVRHRRRGIALRAPRWVRVASTVPGGDAEEP